MLAAYLLVIERERERVASYTHYPVKFDWPALTLDDKGKEVFFRVDDLVFEGFRWGFFWRICLWFSAATRSEAWHFRADVPAVGRKWADKLYAAIADDRVRDILVPSLPLQRWFHQCMEEHGGREVDPMDCEADVGLLQLRKCRCVEFVFILPRDVLCDRCDHSRLRTYRDVRYSQHTAQERSSFCPCQSATIINWAASDSALSPFSNALRQPAGLHACQGSPRPHKV